MIQRLLLAAELATWRRAGKIAVLWWRDDDARTPSQALDTLLQLSDRHAVPVALAVIPDGSRSDLAAVVASHPLVQLVQHGVDHQNRRVGGALGEFPLHWEQAEIVARLQTGWEQLASLPGAVKIFVPPWNDAHPKLPAALAACGYVGWSAAERSTGRGEGPPRLDSDIDVLSWRGGARFKGTGAVLSALRAQLVARRRQARWSHPIGFVTHHRDMDPASWAFYATLLNWTTSEPGFAWARLDALLQRPLVARAHTPWRAGRIRTSSGIHSIVA
jgi:hypothetical protein